MLIRNEASEDLALMHQGKPPVHYLAEQEYRRRLGAVMLNLEMYDQYRRHASRPGIAPGLRQRYEETAAWHFDQCELAAEWFWRGGE